MPLIKSLFTVRYSQIADVVNRKVNRDAMIEVTIKDNRRVTTKAKIHLSKVGNDGQKLN